MSDFWSEIFTYLYTNKKRSILSAIGIIWGIYIMVLLIGVSNGFENGVAQMFSVFSKKSVTIYAGETSIATDGTTIGTKILFNEQILNNIQKSVQDIQYISPEVSVLKNIKSNKSYGTFEVKGVGENIRHIKQIETSEGRFLNKLDAAGYRKVAVIGPRVAELLFYKNKTIGQNIIIAGESFKVIGVMKQSLANMYDTQSIYIPYSTFSSLFTNNVQFNIFSFVTKQSTDIKETVQHVKNKTAKLCHFDVKDDKAIYISTMKEQSDAFSSFFSSLRFFIMFIGFSSLLGGILGIGNVMYASVHERTREIGIRKAIGAKTSSIKKMIVGEALVLTTISGLIGITLGIITLWLISLIIPEDTMFFKDPSLNITAVIVSTIILTFAGIFAGLSPATYASKIQPIEALKTEN